MNYKNLYFKQLKEHYCTTKELQYSNSYNYHLSFNDLEKFYEYKDAIGNTLPDYFIKLDLKTFNSKGIYFSKCIELLHMLTNLTDLIKSDYENNYDSFLIRNMPEIIKSRIYSELDGSLNIENIPTTRKRFDDIVLKGKDPLNINDIIIKNMANAIEFVLSKPAFNKENLYKLYNILSKDSLEKGCSSMQGDLYRDGEVYIDDYKGCPKEKINECMDSLFDFINKNLNEKGTIHSFLPHIAHYYILYIHPYFDFNGRTARMVSLWIYLLSDNKSYLPFISDAINQTKKEYYHALRESRNSHNDITYFLLYITNISISFFLTYLNIENISSKLLNSGISVTNLDKDYLKRILISESGPFTYKDFIMWNHIEISKQGALKILNRFIEYGFLKEVETKNNKKLFAVNKDILIYQDNNKLFN